MLQSVVIMPHLPDSGCQALVESILREIKDHGPVTFARFMEQCLYHPEHGYYTHGGSRIGRDGDFFTVSDVGTDFGACVARQIGEIDLALGRPERFSLLEFGAGRGLLARDILDAVAIQDQGLSGRLRYTLVDRSPGMRDKAAKEAAASGAYSKATALANKARQESELGYKQALAQKNAGIPDYVK